MKSWKPGLRPENRLSLKTRFVAVTIAGEVVFGLVLGVTVGLYTIRAEAQQRRDLMRQTTAAIAAGVMPMIADQESARVQAQLDSVIVAMGGESLECLSVIDGAGQVIVTSHCDGGECFSGADTGAGFLDVFLRPQVLEEPVEVDGITLATVRAQFMPMGLGQAIASPLIVAVVVIFAVSLVSLPWTAWLFVRSVAEPLEELRVGANRLAVGGRGLRLHDGREDEIGDVQKALDEMAQELTDREEKLAESYRQMQVAYELEAEAKQTLETLMQMKSDFVAVASHELRSPLAVIRLYADLLTDGSLGYFDAEPTQAHIAIAAAVSRLSSIVADLMDAALLERGMIRMDMRDAELDGIVAETVRDSVTLFATGPTHVEKDGKYPGVVVHVDPIRIRQVLDNLISNAIKYSNGAPLVTVGMRLEKTKVFVDVTDEGRGVPQEKTSRLFEFFGRLDAEDSRSTSGLGLGLAISERVARAHGGALTFRPNPSGRGSIFTLALPVGRGEVSRECPATSTASQ